MMNAFLRRRARRPKLPGVVGVALAGLAWAGPGATAAPSPKPNIILILADDLGWVDTSFTGSRYYRTPNIERLAKRGVFFPNAYSASPLCSPTRSSIMTGQNPARTGFTAPVGHVKQEVLAPSVQHRAPATSRQLGCQSITRLKTDYYTLAEALHDAGYVTGHFGKWHLGAEPYSPLQHGFDVDIPHWPGPGPAGSFVAPWRFPNFKPRTPHEHIEDRMGDEAVAFMTTHAGPTAKEPKPFFLNYWQFSVHAPFDAKKDLIAEYEKRLDPTDPQRCPTYAAMVHSLDDNVGKIMDAMDRLGIADNTIIIFYSDNGGNMYDRVHGTAVTSNAPLRGGKATMYEGGIRVPAIVVWPGVVKGGTRQEAFVQTEDLYPTILAMCGARARPEQPCDGLSMVPALRGEEPLRQTIACYFPHDPKVPDWLPPSVCVRQGDWKLIRIFFDGPNQQHRYELYNLRDDLGERHNLAAKMPQKVRELDLLIEHFLRDTHAVVPKPNPAYSPEAEVTVGGWQAVPGTPTVISFNARMKSLQYRAMGTASAVRTASPIKLPAGNYRFEVHMEPLAEGDGRVSLLGAGDGPPVVASQALTVKQDRQLRTYGVDLKADNPVEAIRFSPCSGSGTVQVEWIRLLDRDGKALKEWRFAAGSGDRGPKSRPQTVVSGWQAGSNGHAAATLKDGALHLRITGGDPMIMSTGDLKLGPGSYVFNMRMLARADGNGQVLGRPGSRGYLPGTGTPFPVEHDGQWREYRIKLTYDHPLHELRLDPCAGKGEVLIDWIRLDDANGKQVKKWDFAQKP